MEQNHKKIQLNVYTASVAGGLKVSAADTRQVISATNNRAQYFAELAEKYKDEAKLHRDNAKYYAEQNSDVTFEYIDNVKNSLLSVIETKQPNGDYALRKELPENISELENDVGYSTKQELLKAVPSQENCEGRFLYTNGEETSWKGINSFSLFDTKLSDHVLEGEESFGWALQGTYVYKEALAGSHYGYPDFYAKCLEEQTSATATEVTLGGSVITMYVNSNGHQFYDIADKEIVDNFFTTMGMAWYYGIDTENERIFLPRNNYFDQATGNISEVGRSIEAGLPNITGKVANTLSNSASGAFSMSTTGDKFNVTAGSYAKQSLHLNASRSSAIYGKSDTVQPNAVKKLLYICVGNTTNYEGMTEVVNQGMEILEQVAQKVNVDGTNLNNEGKSLFAGYAMPSNKYIDLTLGASGTTYTAPANGYYILHKSASSGGQYINLVNKSKDNFETLVWSVASNDNAGWLLVEKGDVVRVAYTMGGSTDYFRFYYAVGSESEVS